MKQIFLLFILIFLLMKLSNNNLQLIADIENWCTYRQSDGALMAFNSMSGRLEPIRSFNLDNIPEFDALLLFGGNPRPVKYAALVMHYFKVKFSYYPEFLTIGGAPNKGQAYSKPENDRYEDMMLALGFAKDVIYKNHIFSESRSTKENIAEIKQIVRNSETLSWLGRPRIAVVTYGGYSLRAAQELGLALSDYELMFFETPSYSQDEAMFVSEKYDGYRVDILLASAWHSMNQQSWNSERLPLSTTKMQFAPSKEDLRHFAEAGYNFYMYPNMLEDLGFNAQEIYQMRNKRKIEITGYNLEGEKIAEGWPQAGDIFNQALIDKFLEQVHEEFLAKGILIG